MIVKVWYKYSTISQNNQRKYRKTATHLLKNYYYLNQKQCKSHLSVHNVFST